MKKLISILLTMAFVTMLTACTQSSQNESKVTSESSKSESSKTEIVVPDEPQSGYDPLDTENQHFAFQHLTQSVLDSLEKYQSFIEFPEEKYSVIVLTPKSDLSNFEFYKIEYNEDYSVATKGEVLYSADTLTTKDAFIVDWFDPGVLPQRAISFTDENGKEIIYTLEISGEDGTILLGE